MISNPFNYVGSKDRMLNVVFDNLDTSRKVFIDAFCGGGSVGVNAIYEYDEVIMNDGCWQLIAMLNAIYCDDNFIKNVDSIIRAYNLGKFNKEQFIECRSVYNEKYCKEETFNPYMLYALITHAFSYNMVFNKNGGFSVPSGAGRSYFNDNLRAKLTLFQYEFQKKPIPLYDLKFTDLFDLIIDSYSKEEYKDIMIYLDPPYKTTDGSCSRSYGLKWGHKEDEELFTYLDNFNDIGIHWCLSNVFENKGVENKRLKEWAKDYNVVEVSGINYDNAHYQAKKGYKTVEVLIRNY